jgi:4-amino-4-deoxy-L-arabinose transferase-like glycosyltransferase
LPGYPALLAVMFKLAGLDHYGAARYLQLFIDLGTCFVVGDLGRRMVSDRAGRWAFALAALCPFLANYTALPLTETPTIFFTALGLDLAVAALALEEAGGTLRPVLARWAGSGLATGATILFRPDGGMLLMASGGYLVVRLLRARSKLPIRWAGVVFAFCALAPLGPWTARNWRTFHIFMPLVPASASMPGEFIARGYELWERTWLVDYASLDDISFHVDGEPVDAGRLPDRAFDNDAERQRTLALFEVYNDDPVMTPQLDAQFGELARERIHRKPFRFYVVIPVLRVISMWMRPRIEMLPIDSHWWRYREDPRDFAWAVLVGLINAGYIVLAATGLRRWRAIRGIAITVGFVVLRTAILPYITSPEPRYVLECYPVVIVWAAVGLCSLQGKQPARSATAQTATPA